MCVSLKNVERMDNLEYYDLSSTTLTESASQANRNSKGKDLRNSNSEILTQFTNLITTLSLNGCMKTIVNRENID